MAPRDPARVQLDFPALVAELITTLRLTGTVGLLELSDQVVPAFLIGSRGISFGGEAPAFASAEVSSGFVDQPAANTVIADTGPLPAGTYDLMAQISQNGNVAAPGRIYVLEHRNASNNATLATLTQLVWSGTAGQDNAWLPLIGYIIATNERLRAFSPPVLLNGSLAASIFMRLRPPP